MGLLVKSDDRTGARTLRVRSAQPADGCWNQHHRPEPFGSAADGGPSAVRVSAVALSTLLFALAATRAAQHPIASPETIDLHPGLEMTLFAAEPDIVDPVALTFDEDGRMYVVEMRDYPYGFGADRKPGGAIRLLEDTNGDGKIDRGVLFAEELSFPTSIAPWNGGVIVAAPPEFVFLKDTNGDGKADVRMVLVKGFNLGVTDSNVNGLRWGLDNRLHGVNGGNGGNIVSTRKPGAPVPLRNFDFSFDPETGDFSPTFHTSAGFGLVFDDWGRSFVTYNINHLQQRIIPARYLGRHPGFPPVEGTTSISDHGEMSRIYPVSEPETRVNHPEQSGHFSSAGGMGFIGWGGYPADLPGSVLVCDVVGNVVHRDILEPDGPIFAARRSPAEQTREFFGSRDSAFRPVGIELGPDGALYLTDMQRDVIEHPDYIPEKVKAKLDIRAGDNRGRIYRITPKGGLAHTQPKLSKAKPTEWVQLLGHSNQWWRMTAQRLLIQRRDKEAIPALRRLARAENPLARLHALWTLHGLKSLDEPLVRSALAEQRPGLRENALLLAEALLPGSERFQQRILALAEDPSPRVRFQAALTLGQFKHADCAAALQRIFIRDQAHRWSRLAVMSSMRGGEATLLQSLLATVATQPRVTNSALDALRELSDLCGARATLNPAPLETVLKSLPSGPAMEQACLAVLEGIQAGIGRTGSKVTASPSTQAALDKLGRAGSAALMAAAWRLSRSLGLPETDAQRTALDAAKRRVPDVTRRTEQRIEDIQVLALGSYAAVGETLSALLEGAQPTAVQQAAIDALRQFNETAVATNLVSRWRTLAPSARTAVLNLLLQRVAFHDVLVDAIEQGRIQLGELNLDLEQRRRLMRESSASIMARAAKLIGDEEYSNRKQIVGDWLGRIPSAGDASRGRAPFEKLCAQCHSLDGLGHPVGPDLKALAHRSVEDLLSNILDPNMAIHPNYVSYTAETADGELETGILQSESAETVVLLQAESRKATLARKQIKRLQSSGLSLMPEGLEAGMTPAEMRDLIAFIQQKR